MRREHYSLTDVKNALLTWSISEVKRNIARKGYGCNKRCETNVLRLLLSNLLSMSGFQLIVVLQCSCTGSFLGRWPNPRIDFIRLKTSCRVRNWRGIYVARDPFPAPPHWKCS